MQSDRIPVWKPEDVLPGYGAHIGDGVWLYRCQHCDHTLKTDEPGLHLAYWQRHNWQEHGQKPQPLLP